MERRQPSAEADTASDPNAPGRVPDRRRRTGAAHAAGEGRAAGGTPRASGGQDLPVTDPAETRAPGASPDLEAGDAIRAAAVAAGLALAPHELRPLLAALGHRPTASAEAVRRALLEVRRRG